MVEQKEPERLVPLPGIIITQRKLLDQWIIKSYKLFGLSLFIYLQVLMPEQSTAVREAEFGIQMKRTFCSHPTIISCGVLLAPRIM